MKKYTYREAALLLGYTYRHVVVLVKTGRLGRKWRTGYEITQDNIDQFVRPKKSGRPAILPSGDKLQKMKLSGKTARQLAIEYEVSVDAIFKRISRGK